MRPLRSLQTFCLSSIHNSNPRRFASVADSSTDEQKLRQEARTLALSLYRSCIRSAQILGVANELDEKDFKRREEERLEKSQDRRFDMLSMMPPVNRRDELRSRTEYYQQQARELFVQESDCLIQWKYHYVTRFLHHLRQGEKHRQWLLKDMMFEDPCIGVFDSKRVNDFEERALQSVPDAKMYNISNGEDANEESDEEDGFWTSDDET